MKISHVIIHPGHAHMDEFLTLGIALHAGIINWDTPVRRRNPNNAELDSPDFLVLDVGRHHEPQLNNFDHHQLPRGTEECAMSLLAKHLSVRGMEGMTYHDLLKEQPWYMATIIQDALGPHEFASRLGLVKIPIELRSPINTSILELLEERQRDNQVAQLVIKMADVTVAHRVGMAIRLKTRHEQLEKEARFICIKNITIERAGFNALWFDGDDFGIQSYRDKNRLNFVVSIFEAERSPGWGFFRFDDDPRIDFSQLKDDPRVSFAHAGGFYAETSEKVEHEEVLELLSKAMTDVPVSA